MKKYTIFLFFYLISNFAEASNKKNIIQNLKEINNLNFNFEQNIDGKTQKGNCTIQYPKKIFCKYDLANKKILVSDGKMLAIKSTSSYYAYPLNKTPLNIILDKEFILNKIATLNGRVISESLINFTLIVNDNEINLFFDTINFNLIGWQTLDIYQNLNITYLSSIKKNQKINKNLFKIPDQN